MTLIRTPSTSGNRPAGLKRPFFIALDVSGTLPPNPFGQDFESTAGVGIRVCIKQTYARVDYLFFGNATAMPDEFGILQKRVNQQTATGAMYAPCN